MSFDDDKVLVPDFPRTRHLPWKANAKRDDLIASEKEASVIFSSIVDVTEKVDGANMGMARIDGQPVIRNRSHILRKGYSKRTAAKMQFAPVWSWYYENEERFVALDEYGPLSVYGEWLVARHSISYTKLPEYFLAFDLFNQDTKQFLDPGRARPILESVGFIMPPRLLEPAPIKNYGQLEELIHQQSAFSNEKREGVYLKIGDGGVITHRFKMVRPGFIQGDHWSDREIERNKLVR